MSATLTPRNVDGALPPLWVEAFQGLRDTRNLIAARWRAVRSPGARWGIMLGALIILLGVLMASNVSVIVKTWAQQGIDSTVGTFAITWILSLQRGELGEIGAITIGGALIAAVFSPFTGSSTLSLAPAEDLQGVRLARAHRYFDSLAINCVSGIGILQLFALTGVTSVLTIDGAKGPAMLITWAIWFTVIILTTTIGWSLEWVLRRWGKVARRLAGAIGVSVIVTLIVWDTERAKNLYGLGNPYAWMVRGAATGDDWMIIAIAFGILFFAIVLILLGLRMTRKALLLPAPVLNVGKERRARTTPTDAMSMMVQLITTVVVRTPECRRPILGVVFVGVPALLFIPLTENLETAIILAVPLTVSLAWGVNLFGILGSGMTWLTTQPRVIARIPLAAASIHFVVTVAMVMILFGASYLSGNADAEVGKRLLIGAVIVGALSAAVSINLSTDRPIRARLSGRGDSLVPPLTALSYLMRLIVFACIPAFIVSNVDPREQLLYTIFFLVLAAGGVARAHFRWSRAQVRAAVVREVAAN